MEEPSIIEEEVQENGEVKPGKNNFSKRMGNVLRRSKRMMSGKKRHSSAESDKENTVPEANKVNGVNTTPSQDIDSTDSKYNGELSPKRKISQTYFSSEKQIEIAGKTIKEIEVTGEKSPEPPVDMKKQKKLTRRQSVDQSELNVSCRDLGKTDHEGWLQKKAGGHGIVPVSWKKYWCCLKAGKIYCYKTSLNMTADYAFIIQQYIVETVTEKKKVAFRLKPSIEELKPVVFASDTQDINNSWVEILNKVLSGVDVSTKDDNEIPEYEERKRMYSSALHSKDDTIHAGTRKRQSSAFPVETETTGMPAGFGARTQSTAQPRVRKVSAGAPNPDSCLAVGSMFKPLETDEINAPKEDDVDLKTLLFKEVTVESSDSTVTERKEPEKEDIEKLNAEIAKLNSDMLVLNADGERKADIKFTATGITTCTDKEAEPDHTPSIQVEEIAKLEEDVSKPKDSDVTTPTEEVATPEVESPKSSEQELPPVIEVSKPEEDQMSKPEIEVSPPEVEPVKENAHIMEDDIQLEVKDEKTGQERTTSQLFNDFEVATAGDPMPEPAEAKTEEPQTVLAKEPEPEPEEEQEEEAPARERPPPVEEDALVESRQSSEIDTEKVIGGLEMQHKEEESCEKEEKVEPQEESKSEVNVSDKKLEVAPSVTILISSEEDVKKPDEAPEEQKEASEDGKTKEAPEVECKPEVTPKEESVLEVSSKEEHEPEDAPKEDCKDAPKKKDESKDKGVPKEESNTEDDTKDESEVTPKEGDEEAPKEVSEVPKEGDDSKVKVLKVGDETKDVDTPKEGDDSKVVETSKEGDKTNDDDIPTEGDETKVDEAPKVGDETKDADTPKEGDDSKVDEAPKERDETKDEQLAKEESTSDESLQKEDASAGAAVAETTGAADEHEGSKPEDAPQVKTAPSTEKASNGGVEATHEKAADETDAKPEEAIATEESPKEVEKTEAGEGSTQVKKDAGKTADSETEAVKDKEKSKDDLILQLSSDMSLREKSCSIDLGDDLDIPKLSLGDSSLSDEISFELASPDREKAPLNNNTEQLNLNVTTNGDANHVVDVN